MALVFFKFAFKSLEQGEGIGRTACKSREDFVMIEPSYFSGACLCHYCTQSDLAISAERDLRAAACGKYRSATKFLHWEPMSLSSREDYSADWRITCRSKPVAADSS